MGLLQRLIGHPPAERPVPYRVTALTPWLGAPPEEEQVAFRTTLVPRCRDRADAEGWLNQFVRTFGCDPRIRLGRTGERTYSILWIEPVPEASPPGYRDGDAEVSAARARLALAAWDADRGTFHRVVDAPGHTPAPTYRDLPPDYVSAEPGTHADLRG